MVVIFGVQTWTMSGPADNRGVNTRALEDLFSKADSRRAEFNDTITVSLLEVYNEEIRDLFANGADIVQIDEPYMQARPAKAREYGVDALNRALEGITGQTAVHICFGYAAVIHARPTGYDFLPELRQCKCNQISIETAQSNLDCTVLETLVDKQIMVGCLDLSDMSIETPEVVAARIRKALKHIKPEQVILAPDCGMKYLPRDVADGKLRAMVQAAKILRKEYGQ